MEVKETKVVVKDQAQYENAVKFFSVSKKNVAVKDESVILQYPFTVHCKIEKGGYGRKIVVIWSTQEAEKDSNCGIIVFPEKKSTVVSSAKKETTLDEHFESIARICGWL